MRTVHNGSIEQTIREICRQEIQSFFEDLIQSKLESEKPNGLHTEAASINSGLVRTQTLRKKVAMKGRVTDPTKDKRLKANREARA